MKWLTPILAMLLLVGCSRNEVIPPPVSEQSEMTVSTKSRIIFSQQYQRGGLPPRVPSQPQPELQSQPTKDEQVQIQQRKIIGYRAKIDTATGKIITYPAYEDEKK